MCEFRFGVARWPPYLDDASIDLLCPFSVPRPSRPPNESVELMPPKTDSPSPAKKRKTETTPVKRGVDFFFKKQLQQKKPEPVENGIEVKEESDRERLFVLDEDDERRRKQEEDDEKFARQLQALEDHDEAVDAEMAKRLAAEEDPAHDPKAQENEPPIKQESPSKKHPITKLELTSSNSTSSLEEIYSIPLDKDPLTFSPAHNAAIASTWSPRCTPYAFLTHAFILINSTRSRLKIVDYLVNTLRVVTHHDPASLLPLVWLTTNAIAPPFEGVELNLGGSIMSKALRNASGVGEGRLKELYDKWGDIGDVAFEAKMAVRTLVKPAALTVAGVYGTLREIARAKGTGSAETKRRLVERLLVSAKGEEVRYIGRTLVQHVFNPLTFVAEGSYVLER
jgi:DNA ligase 1